MQLLQPLKACSMKRDADAAECKASRHADVASRSSSEDSWR